MGRRKYPLMAIYLPFWLWREIEIYSEYIANKTVEEVIEEVFYEYLKSTGKLRRLRELINSFDRRYVEEEDIGNYW